jgi:hypothetical protein
LNIFEALRESHERQRTYAKAVVRTSGDSSERVEAYKQLKSELQAHATAEERFFYMPLMVSTCADMPSRSTTKWMK